MATLADETEQKDAASAEDTQVFRWRVEQFVRLGFSAEMAWLLAGSDADLGRCRALVAAGCTLDLVARIVL